MYFTKKNHRFFQTIFSNLLIGKLANSMKKIIVLIPAIILLCSCGINNTPTKVTNEAKIIVLNGYDKPDSVQYTCDSCEKYIKTTDLLNKVIDQASQEAKQSLKNPLSFIPRSIKIAISPRRNYYYYATNKHVDSCLMADIEYKCIGKNSYGTENEVTSSSLIFLIDDSIHRKFLDEIRLQPLELANEGRTVDRHLSLQGLDGEGSFTVLPLIGRQFSIIVQTTISCVEKGATLNIEFEDKSEIELKNWNDFNCKGTAYFNLTQRMVNELKSKKITHVSFYSDKLQFAPVQANESDYFKQCVNLLSK